MSIRTIQNAPVVTTSQMQYTSTMPTVVAATNPTSRPNDRPSSSWTTPQIVTPIPTATSVRRHSRNSRAEASNWASTGLVST
ncbi:MAG: hypothetical protein R2697_13000 [Ilumatobacteraceae bacterium]